jgi:hypothetical protein
MRPREKWTDLPPDVVEQANAIDAALKGATGRCDEAGEIKARASMDNKVLKALNEQRLMPEMLERLQQCFNRIRETPSGLPEGTVLPEDEISGKQVNWWLLCVNTGMRGTEHRHSREIQFSKCSVLGVKPDADDNLLPPLTFQEFATCVRLECEEGKYWAVEHDLQKLCGRGMRRLGDVSFQDRFDYTYLSSAPESGLRLAAADVVAVFPKAVGGEDKLQSLSEIGLASGGISSFVLPNSWHPSDHLPLVTEFTL